VACTILITPGAEQDLAEAFEYYETQSTGLGRRFIEFVDVRLQRLSVTPLSGSVRYQDVRCCLVRVFPYIIHYTVSIENNSITILRVLHSAQNPVGGPL
jgi:addiction module RelE/StbE family toxin